MKQLTEIVREATTAEQKAVIAEGLKHGKKTSATAKDLKRVDSENLDSFESHSKRKI